jgi:hypothetical protein
MRLFWLGCIFALLPLASAFSQSDVTRASGMKLVFPINEQQKLSLLLRIPQNFRSAQSFKNQNLNNKKIFFIPVNAIKTNQKEMIVVIPKLNSGMSAVEIVDKFTKQFKKSTQKMSILKEQKKEYEGFTHAAKLILYQYKDEVELLNIYAVSGPKHLVIVQYSIKIQNNNQVKPAIAKILTFFNQGVQVKKQPIPQPQIRLKDSI